MYSYNSRPGLDTPPPASNFRRPWSPDPYDPYPSVRRGAPLQDDDYFESAAHATPGPGWRRAREASDNSVEALDLADYAHALRTGRRDEHGPLVPPPPRAFQAYDPYPSSPRPVRPLVTGNTVESFGSVPSMTSGPSYVTHTTHSSARIPSRRPFSLPTPARSFPGHYGAPEEYPYSAHDYPDSMHKHAKREEQETEIDITQIPSWSRGWFAPNAPAASASSRGSLASGQRPVKPDVFDPSYPTHLHGKDAMSPYGTYAPHDPFSPAPYPSIDSHSGRSNDMLPWGGSTSGLGPPVDDAMKEERLRMLEREYGGVENTGVGGDDETEHLIGGVDEKGRLVTQGPKKRAFTRFMQGALALCAAITSIYAALMIKPPKPPPPKGTAQAYVLYVLSVITALVVFYLFLLRPCCFGSRKDRSAQAPQMPGGMMVLPVQHLPGGAKAGKKGKKGKKGVPGMGGDVQVNLIVDPNMFGGRNREDEVDDEDDDDDAERSWAGSAPSKRKRKPKRRSVFAGLAMEAQWKTARAALKRIMAFDVVASLIWAAGFVFILTGKRCPSNEFNGWCDAYNVATAASCFLALAFGFSIFFDIKDLSASRQSPRTRT